MEVYSKLYCACTINNKLKMKFDHVPSLKCAYSLLINIMTIKKKYCNGVV